jgi:tricorn protease
MLRLHAIVAAVLVFAGAAADAQEPIRFARTPDISPDGKYVAFSYLGDIWVVEAIGGVARPVTLHTAHDMLPVFSPDGRQIAFSSNRHGSYDVFVVPVQGGKPTRLTFDSAADYTCGWSPDGKNVLFSSSRSTAFPYNFELYTVPAGGGRARRISSHEGREGVFSPRGDQIAYVRGPGTWYRKGYRGSSNDDVWLCNADGSNNRQLTNFDRQDNSPMWSADGRNVYYVSECYGAPANIVRQEVHAGGTAVGTARPQQLTFHKEDGVHRARISGNGEWIVYECGADLWVVSAHGGSPRKLAIEVHADDKSNTESSETFTQGASEFAISHDEQHVAFVVHGELFLLPLLDKSKSWLVGQPVLHAGKDKKPVTRAVRLTDHPALDHGIAWSPDSKKIIFTSDRGGHEDLYLLEPDDPEHPELTKAHKFKVRPITNTPEAKTAVSFAPDGKRVAFIRAGQLLTMNPDGGDVQVIVRDTQVIDYEWSPDSKWFVYSRMDGSFASELYIVPSTGVTATEPARNVTRYATFNAGVTWSKTGNKLAFISQRRRSFGMFVLSLQKPAVEGAKETNEIDWEDIHLRVRQPAPLFAEEGAISRDGSKVAFRSSGANGDDLWVAASNGQQLTRVTNGNQRPQQIQWSNVVPDLIYFRDGRGTLRLARLGVPGEPATVAFQAKMTVRRDEEFAEMFEQSWRALRDHFYDEKFHGANWEAVHEKYKPLVKHVALKEDLYVLVSLMLGELNASHLGISGFATWPEQTTADLGLLFDESYPGPGLKIKEILKRGPADRRGLDLKPGQVIVAIDKTDLTEQANLSKLLNDKVGETVELQVTADPKAPRRRVEVQAAGRGQIGTLMYDRWVENNAKRVAELSKGKLGYIHIPSMDDAGLERFVRSLYSDNFDKEAIVLDVRNNGGGFTHDQVLNYLGAKEHTFFQQRHGGQGMVLRSSDRKWTKPLVLLINNRSYSDAEIFPSAFRTLGLGKLVGQATGGHVIGTMEIRLIDGSSFRLPRTGVFTVKGVNMEKEGVSPDVLVEDHPDQLAKGIDAQLDKAVEVLQQDVALWKKTKANLALTPADGAPPMPTAGPGNK